MVPPGPPSRLDAAEYLTTAALVEARPWCMVTAAEYLKDLAKPEAAGFPLNIDWVWELHSLSRDLPQWLIPEDLAFVPQ